MWSFIIRYLSIFFLQGAVRIRRLSNSKKNKFFRSKLLSTISKKYFVISPWSPLSTPQQLHKDIQISLKSSPIQNQISWNILNISSKLPYNLLQSQIAREFQQENKLLSDISP